MQNQRSIAHAFTISGMGVHYGMRCTMHVQPAPPDSGIVFQRHDLPDKPRVAACVANVKSTLRCTEIGTESGSVFTIEHLMSALRGMEIDNCLITLDGPEVPIVDGSAAHFVTKLMQAGIVEQDVPRQVVRLTAPVWVSDGQRHVVALPSDRLQISFTFTNDKRHPLLSDQYADYIITPETYQEQIASARTLGWLAEVEALRKLGRLQGGSVDIAVVMDEERIYTQLRFPNELVRHKILDTIGDVALLGHLHAHIICCRSGHEMNARLGRAIWDAVAAGAATVSP
ncbi:MAG TPA: UDP-3-O-[3-hydroxymyristoyl] N-acetylglucosamine deacetylase [Firmicutes bacterium]|nr:UDP-3-O-[3-hydroxymyristoyl] N-acetylglucosamine deacetylase [Bacillota bacterium]